MKVIIAGTRTFNDYERFKQIMDLECPKCGITEVISGCCRGVDKMGERWAKEHGIPVVYFVADWQSYKKMAGPIRNHAMVEYADYAIVLWDGKSRGTQNLIKRIQYRGLKSFVVMI